MTNSGDEQRRPDPYDPYGPQHPQQQPYGQPPYGQPGYGHPSMAYAPDHPKATTALVLGILGMVVCGVLAPFAWWIGKRTLNEIDGSHGQLGGRGTAQAGYVLCIIGTVLLLLGLLAGLLVMVLVIAPVLVSNS